LAGTILSAPICVFAFSILMVAGTISIILAYRRAQSDPLIQESDKSHISG
jgi:hypothetical protein